MAADIMISSSKTVVFAYHNMGVIGLDALRRHNYEIVAVFTHEDDPGENLWFRSVADWCRSDGVPCHTADDVNKRQWIDRIRSLQAPFLFSFYYRRILCREILETASGGAFNLHGSLLPRYRGRAPVNWAILNGETETGVSLHHMVEKADAGDIIGQRRVTIEETDTALDVYRKLEPAAKELLDELLPLIRSGKAPRVPQDESEATTFGRRRPNDGRIDWHLPARDIYNLIRAVTRPYPGAFTTLGGKRLLIWRAAYDPGHSQLEPGVLRTGNEIAEVGTGSGTLRLLEIEYEGSAASGRAVADMLTAHGGRVLGDC